MTDVLIRWDNTQGFADWAYSSGDLQTTTGIGDLENAVALSLFTDARCPDSFVPWDGDRRGWWADSYTDTPLGSTLWMLYRAKKTGTTQLLLQARDAAKNALQWLQDGGIVDTITVRTYWLDATSIGIDVSLTEPQQSTTKVYSYSWSWR